MLATLMAHIFPRPAFDVTAHVARSAEVGAFDLCGQIARSERRGDVRARFAAMVVRGRR